MKKLYLLVILLLMALAQSNFAQDTPKTPSNEEITPTKKQQRKFLQLAGISFEPVIPGRTGDNFPQRIKARGIIEEVSFVPAFCGVFCWSGTAKIRLTEKIKGYEPQYAYVVILCFIGNAEDYLNKYVEVKATKLQTEKSYACGSIVNSINSNGVAFYGLDKKQNFKELVSKSPRNTK